MFLHAGIWLGLGLLIYVFFLHQESPPPRLLGPDSVELQRTRDGYFYIDGQIQSQPIHFLIDTGASSVSISQGLARQAGLDCDRVSTFSKFRVRSSIVAFILIPLIPAQFYLRPEYALMLDLTL